MAQLTFEQAVERAAEHLQAGRLAEAQSLCQKMLAQDPPYAPALHLLGLVATQAGQHAVAEQYLRGALALEPGRTVWQRDLAVALLAQGRPAEAERVCREALAMNPRASELANTLGNALAAQGRHHEAVTCYRQRLASAPDDVSALNNLGNALQLDGDYTGAAECFQRVIALRPQMYQAYHNLANLLRTCGRLHEALASAAQAVRLQPDNAACVNNLGTLLHDAGRWSEAVACLRRAVELAPDSADVRTNLGNALADADQLDAAVEAYQTALRLTPDFGPALNNLGNTFKTQARLEEAMGCFRRALATDPTHHYAHSNMVYTALYDPRGDYQALRQEHQRWEAMHAAAFTRSIAAHENDRDPERRLRVGFVSPNYREHPVGRLVLPLLEHLDRTQVEVFCYSDVTRTDALTDRCRRAADQWREAVPLNDEQLARLVRQDRIDILVDLVLHMSDNRLLTFARKPAPVQVTWAGYPGTTGLSTVDYRLTDPWLDPPGLNDDFYTERSIRLPHSFWCFDPLDGAPEVNAPPSRAGAVTFGCLNNFCKVNDAVLGLWARVLAQVPGSRLLVLAREGSHRTRTWQVLAQLGIAPERVGFVSPAPRMEYLAYHHALDLILDTFPYTGHSTTLDALWMGVPVVSLCGRPAVSRGGLSLLANVGLRELVAESPEAYVATAVELARDPARLAHLRAGLRERMRASPLMDAAGFARAVTSALRRMWAKWCVGTGGTAAS
jgi:protein O-GlcNAc transferase